MNTTNPQTIKQKICDEEDLEMLGLAIIVMDIELSRLFDDPAAVTAWVNKKRKTLGGKSAIEYLNHHVSCVQAILDRERNVL